MADMMPAGGDGVTLLLRMEARAHQDKDGPATKP